MSVKDSAYKFEAVKLTLKQDKNGHILTLSIHPDEIPEDLMRDWVGSRYIVAMVRLSDDDQPILPKAIEDGERAVRQSGMLCRSTKFQIFMRDKMGAENVSEGAAVTALHTYLGIESRAELRVNNRARKYLETLVEEFEKHVRKGVGGGTSDHP
jgi:hypothetical protein